MKIHVTQNTKDILDQLGGYITEARGNLEIKVTEVVIYVILHLIS
jgi:hypothetical protein